MAERILTPEEVERLDWNLPEDVARLSESHKALRADHDRLVAERDDLAMLVRRFCARYHEAELTQQAWDYLKRHGLQGSVVRADAQQERT